MIYMSNVRKIFFQRGLRARVLPKANVRSKRMVEATEGCDINLGKCAKWTQVNKIRETNFVDLH
jgi:hypothetical protein